MERSLSLYKLTEPYKSFSNFHKISHFKKIFNILWADQSSSLFCDATDKHYFYEVWLHVFNGTGVFQKQMNSSRRQYTLDISLKQIYLHKRIFPAG